MTYDIKRIAPLFFAAILGLSSCAGSTASDEEKAEISQMDSTSKEVKETTAKLEEETDKVEASLEKLDKEFDSDTANTK